jgi:molybdopterin synthase catalytic subunit
MMFRVQAEPLDVQRFREAVTASAFGAVLVFEGVARDHFEGRPVTRLEYEAYGEMAVAEMRRIADEASKQWPQVKIAIGHRTGVVAIGEASLVIAVGAPHRPESYEASRFVLEAIKSRLPVWKKEVYADGEGWKANT